MLIAGATLLIPTLFILGFFFITERYAADILPILIWFSAIALVAMEGVRFRKSTSIVVWILMICSAWVSLASTNTWKWGS